jgi:uncharacterized protein YjbI with pentapeptide repeats
MTPIEFAEVLRLHKLWLADAPEGVRANLDGADLRGACLIGANLRYVYLRGADLSGADLRGACLIGADLRGANLSRADLTGAYLSGADLSGALLCGATLPHHPLPDTGNLIVYKKVAVGVVLRLWVPATAARTCCVQSRKCRVEYAIPLDGNDDGDVWYSARMGGAKLLRYVRGAVARPDSYDDDARVECTHGIHVYATHEEAMES